MVLGNIYLTILTWPAIVKSERAFELHQQINGNLVAEKC
jgi:hypothetical protein